MRRSPAFLAAALAAGLTLAACGDQEEAANELDADAVYGDIDFDEPANDASATEMAADEALEPAEPGPVVGPGVDTVAEPGTGGVLGETDGGDTGGNTVESNVTGM